MKKPDIRRTSRCDEMKRRRFLFKLLIIAAVLVWGCLTALTLCTATRTYADFTDVTFLPHLEDNAIIDGDIDCRIALDKKRLIDSGTGVFRHTLRDSHLDDLLTQGLELRVTINGEELAEPVARQLSLDDEITVTFTWKRYPLAGSLLLGSVINPFPSARTFTVREEIDRQHYVVDPTSP